MAEMVRFRRVRARYNGAIAEAALGAQRFVAPFPVGWMTWVKPSLRWNMERCRWGTKSSARGGLQALVPRRAPQRPSPKR